MYEMMVVYTDGSWDVYELRMMELVTKINEAKQDEETYAIKVTLKRNIVYKWKW